MLVEGGNLYQFNNSVLMSFISSRAGPGQLVFKYLHSIFLLLYVNLDQQEICIRLLTLIKPNFGLKHSYYLSIKFYS